MQSGIVLTKVGSLDSGASAHGDYLFGWENNTLQAAMDHGCNLDQTCSAAGITAQSASTYEACTNSQQAREAVDGCKFPNSCEPSDREILDANDDGVHRAACSSARRNGDALK